MPGTDRQKQSGQRLFMMMFLVIVASSSSMARADEIRFGGAAYTDVLVREGASMYYVQFPETGVIRQVPKERVDSLTLSADPKKRDALSRQWKETKNARNNPIEQTSTITKIVAPPDSMPVNAQVTADPVPRRERAYSTSLVRGTADEYVTDGMVDRVKLVNVPLRQALKALLRSQNLDFAVEDHFIWISTPDRIRHEPFKDLTTKYYTLNNAGAETLFKLVPKPVTNSRTGIPDLVDRVNDADYGEPPAAIGLSGRADRQR